MSLAGFDFGTTNSLISLVRGEGVDNFVEEDGRPSPSAICYEGTKTIVGRQAKQRLEKAGLGVIENIVRSPKRLLGQPSVTVDGVERSPIDIVAAVVKHIAKDARERRKGVPDLSDVVVTIPVEMDGARRRELRAAFTLAGLRIDHFVHEPLAALYGYFRKRGLEKSLDEYGGKLVLVFDWGGGTLDLTLCRLTSDMVVQVMNDGTDEVGGDIIDEALMNHVLKEVMRERALGPNVAVETGARARLLDRCEAAKIALSARDRVPIFVPDYFRGIKDTDLRYTLTKEKLEEVVAPLLEQGFNRIQRLLSAAGYAPAQVALCLATGGMANMPRVKERLLKAFGPKCLALPENTATLIAEGAAWIAHDRASLVLAKNVELELARNSWLPLIKAGVAMPRSGQVQRREPFHLYCTDPRDGHAKFLIYAPVRPGSEVNPGDPRRCLCVLTVSVNSTAKAFQDRLELTVTLDENLILTAEASSALLKEVVRTEIHSLEFGLRFLPHGGSEAEKLADWPHGDQGPAHQPGSLRLRANVTPESPDQNKFAWRLVPGELMYEYDPVYFDVRLDPPRYQLAEKDFYQPCIACRQAYIHGRCGCPPRVDGSHPAARPDNAPHAR